MTRITWHTLCYFDYGMHDTLDSFNWDSSRQADREVLQFKRRKRSKDTQKHGRLTLIDSSGSEYSSPFTRVTHAELPNKAIPSPTRKRLSKILLLTEIIAVIALVAILFSGINLIKNLNAESKAAMDRAVTAPMITATPTTVSTQVSTALPLMAAASEETGLIAIEASDETSAEALAEPTVEPEEDPNRMPITAEMQYLLSLPTPMPEPQVLPATRIVIEDISVDAPVIQGDSWEDLKLGVGQLPGTAAPGKDGNMVLSGHNDIFGEVFRDLDQLTIGDTIQIYSGETLFTYKITGSMIVEPTQVEVMAPTDTATLTLISCYPYLIDNKRIIITADFTPNP